MLHNVFDEYPGFKFFSANDVLRVRSLNLPEDRYDWGNEHYELISSVLGVPVGFMYDRVNQAYRGGAFGWEFHCDWYEGFSLDELEEAGLSHDEVWRWYKDGCLVGGLHKPAFRGSSDVEEFRFTRAQFWGGSVDKVGLCYKFFECVQVFTRLNVLPEHIDGFLFYPSRDFGFLTAAELLLSGDDDLRALVLVDAYAWALKCCERAVVEDWATVWVGTVPAPGNVSALVGAGIVPSVGDGSVKALGVLSEALRVPWGVLVRRCFNANAHPVRVSWGGKPADDVAANSGIPVDDVNQMCESGDLIYQVRKNGVYWVDAVHLMPVKDEDVLCEYWVFFPDSVRLVKGLRDLGWGDARVVEFLTKRSPWFGLVAPVEYARLGGEYVDAVLAVAQYVG